MGLDFFQKLTERKIPEGWEIKHLSELSKISSGKRLPKGEMLISNQNSNAYIRVADMKSYGVELSKLKYVPEHLVEKIKNYRIYKNDLYISVAGTLGLVGIIDESLDGANLTENANRVFDLKIDKKYLFYFLQSNYIKKIIESISTTGAQPKLALTRIRNFIILYPKNSREQKNIANKLCDIDELLIFCSKLIKKKKEINRSLIKLLVLGKKRLTGFDKKWEESTLGDLLSYEQPTKYISKEKEYNIAGSTPILTANKSFVLGYTDETDCIFNNLPVIIFDDFTTDKKFVPFKFKVRSSALKILKPKSSNIDMYFIFNLMNYINFSTIEHKRYWIAEFQYLKVLIPSFEEQKKISSIIITAQKQVDYINKKMLKLKKIKSSIIEELLTAKTKLS